MALYRITGYPDEENIYHQHHTKIETWITEAKDEAEAEKLGFKHFPYFHEIAVSEYIPPRIKLKVGDIIEVIRRPNTDPVTATVTYVGNDNDTKFEWSKQSAIFGTITNVEILYDWMIEDGCVLSVNGKKVVA